MTDSAFLFAGVDPDRHGAIVVLTAAGKLVSATRTPLLGSAAKASSLPDHVAIGDLLRDVGHLIIEELMHVPRIISAVGKRVQPGARGSAHKGVTWGMWLGAAGALRIPITRVRPQRWADLMLDGKPRGRDEVKASALIRARELFPDLPIPSTARPSGVHQGIVDAALIAEWGRRMYHGDRLDREKT